MYTVTLPQDQSKSYQKLDAAKAFADKQAEALGAEIEIVNDETQAVAYLTSPRAIAKRDLGVAFVPWTRLETPKFAAPEIAGFYPAYTRRRIQATVYRAYDAEAELPWLVHDGRTGGTQAVKTTKAACTLTREMRLGKTL